MKDFPTETFTWGYELEGTDFNKLFVEKHLPPELGVTEREEKDIANLLPPYRGIACDPFGIDPPVGGEINTKPTKTYQAQVRRIFDIVNWVHEQGEPFNVSFTSPGHVHVHVPFLVDDIEAIKRLAMYVKNNQKDLVDLCYMFERKPDMNAEAARYMRFDGGRLMPDFIADNINTKAHSFDDFLFLYGASKDGLRRGRPFRYAVNFYNLKHTQTVEFRCFRASLNPKFLTDSFRVCEAFMDFALNGGPPIKEFIEQEQLEFQPMMWEPELWPIYERTHKENTPGAKGKNRIFWKAD